MMFEYKTISSHSENILMKKSEQMYDLGWVETGNIIGAGRNGYIETYYLTFKREIKTENVENMKDD